MSARLHPRTRGLTSHLLARRSFGCQGLRSIHEPGTHAHAEQAEKTDITYEFPKSQEEAVCSFTPPVPLDVEQCDLGRPLQKVLPFCPQGTQKRPKTCFATSGETSRCIPDIELPRGKEADEEGVRGLSRCRTSFLSSGHSASTPRSIANNLQCARQAPCTKYLSTYTIDS
jgi:hypothetical protein